MDKQFILLILLCCIASYATPQVRWLEQSYNFGRINEADGEVCHTFRMVNESSAPSAIVHIQSSCGCTRVNYPTQAIAPGDTADVTVFFDPKGLIARFNKNVYVKLATDNDSTHRILLSISGTIKGTDETLTKKFLGNFGSIRTQTRDIRLLKNNARQFALAYNNSDDTISIDITKAPTYLTVRTSPVLIPPSQTFHFIFKAQPDSTLHAQSAIKDTLRFTTNNGQHLAIPIIIEN